MENTIGLPYPLSKTQKNHSGFPDSQPLKTFVIITIRVFFHSGIPVITLPFYVPQKMAGQKVRTPNNQQRIFSGIPQSMIVEGCLKRFFTDNREWCLVSDKQAITLHVKSK